MLSRNRGCDCTKELVEQVAQQLATRAVRDSELENATELSGEEYVAIVQGGISKKISVQPFLDAPDIPLVTHVEDGLMSSQDKTKLDEISDIAALTNLEIENLLR